MKKVKNRRTGENAVYEEMYDIIYVFELPRSIYERCGKTIAKYKTWKGFWQRWEAIDD